MATRPLRPLHPLHTTSLHGRFINIYPWLPYGILVVCGPSTVHKMAAPAQTVWNDVVVVN